MHIICIPGTQIFTLWWTVFELWSNLGKVHQRTPKWPWHIQVKGVHMDVTNTPRTQFSSVSLYNQPFSSYNSILWKCTAWMTPNDLDLFKIKIPIGILLRPKSPKFSCFALRWAVWELRVNFVKSAPSEPKWPWHVQKYPYGYYTHARGA